MHGNVTHVLSHSHPAHSSRRQFIQLSITSPDRLSPSATATIHQDRKRQTLVTRLPCFPPLSHLLSFSFIPSFLNYWVCGGGDFSIFNLLNAMTQTFYILCVCVFLKNVLEARVHNSSLRFSGVGNLFKRTWQRLMHVHMHTS